jgi:hypothetical protein
MSGCRPPAPLLKGEGREAGAGAAAGSLFRRLMSPTSRCRLEVGSASKREKGRSLAVPCLKNDRAIVLESQEGKRVKKRRAGCKTDKSRWKRDLLLALFLFSQDEARPLKAQHLERRHALDA